MFNKLNKYSSTSLTILSFLAANPLEKVYGRDVAKRLDLSTGGVSQALRSLSKQKLLTVEKKGRMLFYSADLSNPEFRGFKVWLNISGMMPLVDRLKEKTDLIFLFGSAAEGTDTSKSDFDLLVVTDQKDAVRTEIRKFKADREIKAVVVNKREFKDLRRDDKAFYEQVMKGKELWRREIELQV